VPFVVPNYYSVTLVSQSSSWSANYRLERMANIEIDREKLDVKIANRKDKYVQYLWSA